MLKATLSLPEENIKNVFVVTDVCTISVDTQKQQLNEVCLLWNFKGEYLMTANKTLLHLERPLKHPTL